MMSKQSAKDVKPNVWISNVKRKKKKKWWQTDQEMFTLYLWARQKVHG